jgi:hypothetical protein
MFLSLILPTSLCSGAGEVQPATVAQVRCVSPPSRDGQELCGMRQVKRGVCIYRKKAPLAFFFVWGGQKGKYVRETNEVE